MATRKKNVSAEKPTEQKTARQKHTVVTQYEKDIPIDDLEETAAAENAEDDLDHLEFDDEPLDEVEAFLDEHGIRSDSEFTWSMVVERLPDYERNRRNDVGARRKSCGERPFTPDFEEQIRREFARPGLSNDFRVTIKRNGKFFRNWPHVISLEPPPPAVIMEEETKRNALPNMPMAQLPYPAAAPVTLKTLIEQARQFAELQKYLLPGGLTPAPAKHVDDEDLALLNLLKLSPELTQKMASKLAGRIFNGAGDSAGEPSTSRIVELALENGPAIIDRIFQGFGLLKGQPLLSSPEQNGDKKNDSSLQSMASIIMFAHAGMTPDYVCDWLIDRSEGDESLSGFIDQMARMDVMTMTGMMSQIKPDLKVFIESPEMQNFVAGLIHYLNTTDETESEVEAPAS
jgi:hypothetical protein